MVLKASVRAYVAHMRRYEHWIPFDTVSARQVAEEGKRLFEQMAQHIEERET